MTTIQTAQAAQSTCPPDCAGHLDGPVHISNAQITSLTGDGEQHDAFTSLELRDGSASPETLVRLVGAGDAPMQPMQAIELGRQLVAAGLTAMTTWAVTS